MKSARKRGVAALLLLAAMAVTVGGAQAAGGVYGAQKAAAHSGKKVIATEANNKYLFSPKKLTVKAGTTVTFTNKSDAPHTVTANKGNMFNKSLPAGKSVTITFKKAGTYAYRCTIHPYMKGTIVVTH